MANRNFNHPLSGVHIVHLAPLPADAATVEVKEGVAKTIEFRVVYPADMPPRTLQLELCKGVLKATFKAVDAESMRGVHVQVVFPRGQSKAVVLKAKP